MHLNPKPCLRGCAQVLLVGGFASSPYLQTRVLAALQGEVDTVVVSPRPYSAVLNGGYTFEAPPVWGSREAGTRSQQQVPPNI